MADVRVGIVSWNTADLLDGCLAALPDALAGLDADVVVVDNASADESADVAERHPHVRLIRNTDNVGYARAMNQALAGPPVPVLIALNPDTLPGPGSLATLVQRLLDEPHLGLIAPRLLNTDGSDQHSVYRFPSVAVATAVCFAPRRWQRRSIGNRMWLEGFSDHRVRTDIDWAIGAVHVIRSEALSGRTPYSERWFMYVEDLDLCWWLATHGWRRRLEGDVAIPHVGNAAGAQKWGDERTARWTEATYDWYGMAKGRVAMRLWAAANVAGLLWLILKRTVVWSVRPAHKVAAGTEARRFASQLPQHLRILVTGPRAT